MRFTIALITLGILWQHGQQGIVIVNFDEAIYFLHGIVETQTEGSFDSLQLPNPFKILLHPGSAPFSQVLWKCERRVDRATYKETIPADVVRPRSCPLLEQPLVEALRRWHYDLPPIAAAKSDC